MQGRFSSLDRSATHCDRPLRAALHSSPAGETPPGLFSFHVATRKDAIVTLPPTLIRPQWGSADAYETGVGILQQVSGFVDGATLRGLELSADRSETERGRSDSTTRREDHSDPRLPAVENGHPDEKDQPTVQPRGLNRVAISPASGRQYKVDLSHLGGLVPK